MDESTIGKAGGGRGLTVVAGGEAARKRVDDSPPSGGMRPIAGDLPASR
jgi:hypothetical protein